MAHDAERVTAFARARFGSSVVVEKLLGDASDRAFYRVKTPALSSLILMVHREPFDLQQLPFFLHARFLLELGAAVPQIVASYPADGILIVQDLGDEMLQGHLTGADPDRRRFLYLQAVQIIAFLQDEGTRAVTPDLPAAVTALDFEKLIWELRFFTEHYVRGLKGSPLTADQDAALDDWFVWLAREVAGYRRVLCHRDFHSRNLMVKGDRLFMVDFQDLRMGPYTYDVASLLRDSYLDLPEELVREMLEFFREASRAPEPAGTLETAFGRTCLQRNIKALGTFASQAVVKNNRSFLPHIPRTLAHVVRNLEREAAGSDEIAASSLVVLGFFRQALDWKGTGQTTNSGRGDGE